MPLSNVERMALKAEAEGLRADISAMQSQRTDALANAELALEDEKLMEEVGRLKAKRDAEAAKLKNLGVAVTADEAVALMNAAAEQDNSPATSVAPSVDFGLDALGEGGNE